jgi:hypothetical protein
MIAPCGGRDPTWLLSNSLQAAVSWFPFFYFSSHNLDMAHLQINETLYLYVYM